MRLSFQLSQFSLVKLAEGNSRILHTTSSCPQEKCAIGDSVKICMSLSCSENLKNLSHGVKMETSLGKHCRAVWKQAFVLQFESIKLLLQTRIFPQKEDILGEKKEISTLTCFKCCFECV